MSLSFIGPSGSFERRWIVYAMLRDNVQFHLERGTPTADFAALHALGDALAKGQAVVPALVLRREVEAAQQLLARPVADLAVTLRTRAVCMLLFPLPAATEASLLSETGWSLPFPTEGANALGDLFGSLVDDLLKITETAKEGDEVTVIDG